MARVPLGVRVLDVGTDHGHIPIHLALQGYTGTLYASDVAVGPLEAARRNAERYGVSDRIDFRLADGIAPELAPGLDCVIIAGMGGETILGIVQAATLLCPGTLLILQPQSKLETLLGFLNAGGFTDTHLTEVFEGRRKYTIITTVKL